MYSSVPGMPQSLQNTNYTSVKANISDTRFTSSGKTRSLQQRNVEKNSTGLTWLSNQVEQVGMDLTHPQEIPVKHSQIWLYTESAREMQERKTPELGLGTGMDNRTGIFTGISPQNRYFAPVYRSAQCCSDLLSLSSYINGHSQEFDFYARFRGFLGALPRAYWQER